MIEQKRSELIQLYQKWAAELKKTCPQLICEKYSYPYYLHIPDNWYACRYRILIVGEEGYGEKRFDTSIEDAQAFNRDYLWCQLKRENKGKYGHSSSAFWRRVRAICDLFGGEQYAITWTNIDKVHRSGRGNCKLKKQDRAVLHDTPTKILSEEIKLLQPTHVIYFGWYGVSLEAELPLVFDQLYPAGRNDNTQWKNGRINTIWVDGVLHIFSYHPNWGYRQGDYEPSVLEKIKETIV